MYACMQGWMHECMMYGSMFACMCVFKVVCMYV